MAFKKKNLKFYVGSISNTWNFTQSFKLRAIRGNCLYSLQSVLSLIYLAEIY